MPDQQKFRNHRSTDIIKMKALSDSVSSPHCKAV